MAQNSDVEDTKPQNQSVGGLHAPFETEQLYTVVIPAGQSIGPGFFMYIPYLTAGTVQSPVTS